MPLFNYSEMVKALAKPGAAFIEGLTPDSAHLLHMAVGISGETGELLLPVIGFEIGKVPLNRVNIIEECGDIEFYLEGYRQGIEISRDQIVTSIHYAEPAPRISCVTMYDYAAAMSILAADILDTIKKQAVYVKPLNVDRAISALAGFERYFSEFRRKASISRDETLDTNMAKLAKRYTGLIYTDTSAQERADKPKGE